MKNIGLIINLQDRSQFSYVERVVEILLADGFNLYYMDKTVDLDGNLISQPEEFFEKVDAIVTLGGDGTILRVAPFAAKYSKPILGVNLGHLGYLAQLERNDIDRLPQILGSEPVAEARLMLSLELVKTTGETDTVYALNDVTISRQIVSNMVHINLYSNDEFVYRFRSDGLIFATPTGSTAYSMSSGGPVADCSLQDIILVTPVCEHSFFSKSMIFSAQDVLRCIVDRNRENTFVMVDGKMVASADTLKEIHVKKSPFKLLLLQPDGKRFYRVLNSKFSNEGKVL